VVAGTGSTGDMMMKIFHAAAANAAIMNFEIDVPSATTIAAIIVCPPPASAAARRRKSSTPSVYRSL
jgi:hypothetical protein